MIWYLAPIFSLEDDFTDVDPTKWVYAITCPGAGSPVEPYNPGERMIISAYDEINGLCIVGFNNQIQLPSGWTIKTIEEITILFTTMKGRAPSSMEIF